MAGRVAVLFGWLTDKVPGRGLHLRPSAPEHRLSLLYPPKFAGVKKENTIPCVPSSWTTVLGIHHALVEANTGEEVRSGNRESSFRVAQCPQTEQPKWCSGKAGLRRQESGVRSQESGARKKVSRFQGFKMPGSSGCHRPSAVGRRRGGSTVNRQPSKWWSQPSAAAVVFPTPDS